MKKMYRYEFNAPMTSEQQALATRYIPFARALLRHVRNAHPRLWDDLESAAMFALIHAALTFDPGRNIPFCSYAGHRIKGALRDVERSSRSRVRRKRTGSGDTPQIEPLSLTSELRGLVLNTNADPPIGAEIEATEEVERQLRKLPPKHASACRLLYIKGKPQREVALILGCSRSRLSAINREAISVLSWWQPDRGASLNGIKI